MKCGDLSSLYHLGVGMNWGFGAILIFVQPAKRLFDQSIAAIESRLFELNSAQEQGDVKEEDIDQVFDLNRSYLQIAADARYLSLEAYIWQSVPSRLIFLLSGFGCLTGLIISSYYAETPATTYNFVAAVLLNFVPMLAAFILFVGWCWFEYRLLPRVEKMEEKLFHGPTTLASQLRLSS
jgi:hypothetical protein